MSERILMKFIVGQRVVKEGEDSRFEGEVVACFVKRDLKTLRYVVENDDGVLHIASERQLRWPCLKRPGRLKSSHSGESRLSRGLAVSEKARASGVDVQHEQIVAEQERTKISERTKAAPAAAKARGVKLGNPRGPKPFTAEIQRQGVAALRQAADARGQQFGEIFAEYAGVSANATAKALNERGPPSGRGASGRHVRSSTSAPAWRPRRDGWGGSEGPP